MLAPLCWSAKDVDQQPHTLDPQVMQTAKQRQTTAAKAQAGERLGGRARVALVSDRHYLEFLPLVLDHYGRALCCGCAHVYQALPRLLTLWFQAGTAAATKGQRPGKKVTPACVACVMMMMSNEGDNDRDDKINNNDDTTNNSNNLATAQELAALPAATKIVSSLRDRVPSAVWMAALPQLISRVCHPQADVATLTRSIIAAAAQAHPQQALWALAVVLKSSVDARKAAAQEILSNMARRGDAFRSTANTFRSLVEQLVRLCFHTPVNGRARCDCTLWVWYWWWHGVVLVML